MIKDHLRKVFLTRFKHDPTVSQKLVIEKLLYFTLSVDDEKKNCFILTGYAGTGKTSLLSAYVNMLDEFKIRSVLMAPTGRAAKVFSSFSGLYASTIHKVIYRQKKSNDGFGVFVLNHNKNRNTLFVCDEASMIGNESREKSIFGSGHLLNDLIEYVYSGKGCRLILVGDKAQLPPVGYDFSIALDSGSLQHMGMEIIHADITEIVRQAAESGILFNASRIRYQIEENNIVVPKLSTAGFHDFNPITGNELIEHIENAYREAGVNETIIVTRSNKRANIYNNGIRTRILFRDNEIEPGDLLMVVKNNYFFAEQYGFEGFIANGDIVKLVKVMQTEERYGFQFAHASIELIDYDNQVLEVILLLNTLQSETASLTSEEQSKLFYAVLEDYRSIKGKKKQIMAVKEDPYFNAIQIKFAYAVTCHKAQGGQWKRVFVDQGYFLPDMLNVEYLRWLYTAFTRATDKIFLVNFDNKFLS